MAKDFGNSLYLSKDKADKAGKTDDEQGVNKASGFYYDIIGMHISLQY